MHDVCAVARAVRSITRGSPSAGRRAERNQREQCRSWPLSPVSMSMDVHVHTHLDPIPDASPALAWILSTLRDNFKLRFSYTFHATSAIAATTHSARLGLRPPPASFRHGRAHALCLRSSLVVLSLCSSLRLRLQFAGSRMPTF